MGGIGIFFSFLITLLIFRPFEHAIPFNDLMVGAGALLMFAAGFLDDRFELQPLTKFILQFLAASALVAGDLTISAAWPFWLAIPLTYIWIIGVTNAFNLLDNMDGLAAGIALIVSITVGGLAIKLGLPSIAAFSFILAGSTGGFLIYNYNPAKIFMGDCGSLFIGFMIAALLLRMEPTLSAIEPAGILPVFIAVVIIPIFDTTLVTFIRLFVGRSLSQGGQDHTSHRLVYSGLSERTAVHYLYGISVYFALLVILFYPALTRLFYLLFAASLVGLFFFGLYLSRLNVYEGEDASAMKLRLKSIPPFFKRNIQLGVIIVDVILIITSFALAHIIRFEHWTPQVDQAVTEVLPGVIVLKVLLLGAFGTYHRLWNYAGVADLVRLLMATFLGSLLAGVFSWIYMDGYLSISVFGIDFFVFTSLVVLSRFAFKGLRRLFATTHNGGAKVLLYGAGDEGWLALSEIRQNSSLKLDPVGFIDESPYKQKGKIQGLKVLGDFSSLLEVCEQYEIDEVLICIRDFPKEKREMVQMMCAENNIMCKRFTPAFNSLDKDREPLPEYEELVLR
jgi:UDP-GlcNAc:undecaprenyl-phosphate GlcNAc-1-phosphate transferase